MTAIQGTPDPWVIQPRERARYEDQFRTLRPVNGIVTGDQAKGFFLQSQLPPAILGQIWSLADTDSDGKMDIEEFSIACKLINLKLRNFELPKTLPPCLFKMPLASNGLGGPTLIQSPPQIPPNVPQVPLVTAAIPTIPPVPAAPMRPAIPPMVMSQPIQPLVGGIAPISSNVASLIQPIAAAIPPMVPVPAIPGVLPVAATIPNVLSSTVPMPVAATVQNVLHSTAPNTILPITTNGIPSQAAPPPRPPPVGNIPAAPSLERIGSIDSPHSVGSPVIDWAVPHQSKLKYTQVFNTTDRSRSGYLSGPQARNIMVQSGLPQAILAQIWALADMDSDGRLSCEEFVLALHLCDMAKSGEKIPSQLPLELIPPTFRRQRQGSVPGSAIAVTAGSVSATGIPSSGSIDLMDKDAAASLITGTFEDKRKENFEKGQAELERRRKTLLEIQRKEQEERERKEKEEQEKRERIRQEQERRRQAELEKQLQRQRELEQEREEQRLRAQEQREAARREMERQRQLEWGNQRSQELQQQRQREQEKVLKLKAHNQNLSIELSTLNDKVKELSQKISDTRIGVSGVKTTIDGMRTTRDTQMSEMSAFKAKLKEQNQRLLALSHEKARLEAKNKANAGTDVASQEQNKIAFSNKQITMKQLRDRIEDLQKEISVKLEDIENNNTQLSDLRTQLSSLIQECEKLYTVYELKKEKILELKGVSKTRDPTDFTTSWGDSAWGGPPAAPTGWAETEAPISEWPVEETTPTATADLGNANIVKYRAIYEFVARNNDELSFQPGDIIMVPLTQNAEPGWLAGELRGHTGWFPETYVEPADSPTTITENIEIQENTAIINGLVFPPDIIMSDKRQLEGIAEVPENVSDNGSFPDGEVGPPVSDELSSPISSQGESVNIQVEALYSWKARKSTQISFNRNDIILVSEQQDQWFFGEINAAKGWFPKSYVKVLETDDEPKEYYESIYPYESGEAGDLTFQQGDIILVIKKEGDWWTGIIEDRQGIFPSNYVQPAQIMLEDSKISTDAEVAALSAIETHRQQLSSTQPVVVEPAVEEEVAAVSQAQPQPIKERTPSTPDALGQGQWEDLDDDREDKLLSKGKGKKPEVATVIAPYQATSEEQLTLQRGQLVMVRQKSSTGWWEGELQTKGKKRQIGWFPASYVKVMGGQSSGSARSTPISHKHQEELLQKQQMPVSPTPNNKDDPPMEKVRALYSYQALNDDELSFEKGDVISLLVKEEEAWWRGDLNGVSGLFPKNYVEIISDEQLSPMETKRQGYIMELITTEQSYIDDMSIVHEVFEKPLIESKVLTPEEIEKIFVNWRDIIVCNYTFLRALRIRRDNSERGCIRMIGDILCENLPRMSAYVRFCSCQLRAATFLQQLHETSPEFHALVKQCQGDLRTQGLPLSSFLIKPMQRITKYPLLIKKILENTPENHPDWQNIQEALYKAEEFCFQVNEGVREKENSERLEWLQRHVNSEGLEERLVFNSLTNSLGPRKLLHYGLLNKAKSGKELVGFLFNDFFLLAQPYKSLQHNQLFAIDSTLNISFKIYKKPMFLNEWCVDMVGPSPPPGSIVPPSEASDSPRLLRMLHLANKTYLSLLAPTAKDRITWLKHLDQTRRDCLELEKNHQQLIQTKKAQFGACGRILVGVTEGIGLRSASGKCDAFCEVSMGSQEHRTKVYPGSCDPKWNSSMQFLVKDVREDVLCITVFDQGYFSPNEFLGRTEVRVCDILRDTQTTPGPIVKKLRLHECERGEIILKLDLRLFGNAFEMMQLQR